MTGISQQTRIVLSTYLCMFWIVLSNLKRFRFLAVGDGRERFGDFGEATKILRGKTDVGQTSKQATTNSAEA
jgi:hypothetical protein